MHIVNIITLRHAEAVTSGRGEGARNRTRRGGAEGLWPSDVRQRELHATDETLALDAGADDARATEIAA